MHTTPLSHDEINVLWSVVTDRWLEAVDACRIYDSAFARLKLNQAAAAVRIVWLRSTPSQRGCIALTCSNGHMMAEQALIIQHREEGRAA